MNVRVAHALDTERLQLEPIVAAHTDRLFEDLREGHLYEHMKGFRPSRRRDLRARFRAAQRGRALDSDDLQLQWAAHARTERRYVGVFQATLDEEDVAELGYLVFKPFWRRGYALEACRRILQHLFDDHDATAIVAVTAVGNAPARALAARLGLRPVPDGSIVAADGVEDGLAYYVLERPRSPR